VIDLVGDCASDPPLAATARRLAVARADELVYGLGVIALERRHRTLGLAARHADAREALAAAITRLEAKVELIALPDAWPARIVAREVVRAEALVNAAERARGAFGRAYVTVAGAVRAPAVRAADPLATVEKLVADAGGALDEDWVAVAGGAPGGRLVERATPARELGSLVLILPAGHEVVRRLRMPVGDWLRRAASACEGCRICSGACPQPLSPHEIVWTLSTLRDDGTDLTRALHCTGCGLCDAMCPAVLSPRALVVDVRDRFVNGNASASVSVNGNANANASGLDVGLLTLRLGLAPYDRAPDCGLLANR
jgi:ferredoxin